MIAFTVYGNWGESNSGLFLFFGNKWISWKLVISPALYSIINVLKVTVRDFIQNFMWI